MFAASVPRPWFDEIWQAASKFLVESPLVRSLELASLAQWIGEHWLLSGGIFLVAVALFSGARKTAPK